MILVDCGIFNIFAKNKLNPAEERIIKATWGVIKDIGIILLLNVFATLIPTSKEPKSTNKLKSKIALFFLMIPLPTEGAKETARPVAPIFIAQKIEIIIKIIKYIYFFYTKQLKYLQPLAG